jgi:hypothetical protein
MMTIGALNSFLKLQTAKSSKTQKFDKLSALQERIAKKTFMVPIAAVGTVFGSSCAVGGTIGSMRLAISRK